MYMECKRAQTQLLLLRNCMHAFKRLHAWQFTVSLLHSIVA